MIKAEEFNKNFDDLEAAIDNIPAGPASPASPYIYVDSIFNTGVGDGALPSNPTGKRSTATGYQALHNNTAGESNTANGN